MTMTDTEGLVGEPEAVTKAKRTGVPAEIGGTGLRQFGGVLFEEYLPALQGDRAVQVYKEMGHDPIVGGMMLAIQNLVRRVEWTVDPADGLDSGDSDADAGVEFIEGCLDDMSSSFADTMAQAFTDVQYGWSYLETVYKQRNGPQPDEPEAAPSSKFTDGKFGWRKWPIRSQDSKIRWDFDDNGGVKGLWQLLPIGGMRYVPIQVALLFRTGGEKDSPEGQSVLRSAYRPWYFKRRIEEIEAIGIERDAAGLPVAYCPSAYLSEDATDAMKAVVKALEDIVTGIRRNEKEGLVFPRDYDEEGNPTFGIELMSSGGSRQIPIGEAIVRKNVEITICAMADWMMLGHTNSGSRALADPKVDLFTTALETWCIAKAEVINSHAIPRLFAMNGMDLTKCPRLRPSRVSQVDVKDFASTVAQLLQSGAITPDEDLEAHVRTVADLPPQSAASLAQTPPDPNEVPQFDAQGNPIPPDQSQQQNGQQQFGQGNGQNPQQGGPPSNAQNPQQQRGAKPPPNQGGRPYG